MIKMLEGFMFILASIIVGALLLGVVGCVFILPGYLFLTTDNAVWFFGYAPLALLFCYSIGSTL